MLKDYLPVLLAVLVAVGFSASTLILSIVLGRAGRRTKVKDMAYECGMIPEGAAQPRFSVKFYLVAMLFILFDLEVVFMFPWAVNYSEMIHTQGALIFWSMLGFITLVTVGYVYAICKGVLNWTR